MTKQDLINELERIDCQLSPENLHQDGEISRAQARLRGARLMEKKERLEKELNKLERQELNKAFLIEQGRIDFNG
jgi:hypothetical protein